MILSKKSLKIRCVLFFSTTFVWNISHSQKNSARCYHKCTYRGVDKSLARPGRKQATSTEDFDLICVWPCIINVKVKVKVAFWRFFNTEAIWPIVLLLPTSSRIHLQKRHASYRCARPLPAKVGTITNYYQILLANSNLRKSARIFYMPQSWDKGQILLLPLQRKAYWGFSGHQKNPTASAEFEPANSGCSGQCANH